MMSRAKISVFILFTGITFSVSAADSIIVIKDARLDIVTAKQVQSNHRATFFTSSGQYKGFRIQVISTSQRDDAFRVKAELLAKFPDQKAYAIYQSPNFKVRIGDFIKKEDAEKFKIQLNKFFPQGVYIVEDGIEYTPKDTDEIIPQ